MGQMATGRIVAPMTKATTATMAMAGLLFALAGCGSGGGATGTGGSGGTNGTGGAGGAHPGGGGQGGSAGTTCAMFTGLAGTSTGTVGWKDNGTQECAELAIVVRTPATLADTIEIDASSGLAALDIALSSYSGPLGGTYSCQPGNGTTAPY